MNRFKQLSISFQQVSHCIVRLQFTPEEAKQDLKQQIQRYERNFLTDVEILEKKVTDTEKETALYSTVSYTLKGEIGISKEIFAKAEH